ncbi:glycosyltransferase family 4 protein [Phocaeicola faecalis]
MVSKRICFFEGDMSRGGGTERLTSITANKLAQNANYTIVVLSLLNEKNGVYFPLDENVNHYVLCNKPSSKFAIIKKLKAFIQKYQIDIIVNVDIILGIYSLPLKFKFRNLAVVSWEQFSTSNDLGLSWSKYLRQVCLLFSDTYLVLTDGDRKYLDEKFKVKCSLRTLYNPIEYANGPCTYDLASKTIITAGNFFYTKGFDIAVDVAKLVLTKHPDWKWDFYGDGVEYEAVKKKVQDLRLLGLIRFCGRVSNIEERYKDGALYVMTSRNEGFGLVLLEAKKNHLPTIAFDVPYGPATIIENGISGYLVKPFDIHDMADKIDYLISNDLLRLKFAEQADKNLSTFNIDSFVRQWDDILCEL